MNSPLGRLFVYTKRMVPMVELLLQKLRFQRNPQNGDRIVDFRPQDVGLKLLLYYASKGLKEGQSLVKLVLDVQDIPAFCKAAAANGLAFGAVHQADGYVVANVKHPSNNSVSVSSHASAR